MREIVVEGTIRRASTRTWVDKNGMVQPDGEVVLSGELDKLELGVGRSPDESVLAKVRALVPGEKVRLAIGVESGNSFREDARFTFLDDLTQRPKG